MSYTPELVDYYLRWWRELESAAESPQTSAHLFDWRCRLTHDACVPVPRVGTPGKRYVTDHLRYAVIAADVAAAWRSLPLGSLERRVIAARMAGHSLGVIATLERTRKQTILDAHDRALASMATWLGYVQQQQADTTCTSLA